MNKLLHFSILYLALLLVEMIVGFFCLLLDSFNYRVSFDGVILWTLWRVLFYGVPSAATFWVVYHYSSSLSINYRLFLLSAVNVLVYVGLSCLSEILCRNTPLPANGIMFTVTCIALVISPLLIGQIPLFRRRMDGLF